MTHALPPSSHRSPWWAVGLAAAVLLLAWAARVHDLDAQSLWNDEGNSLRLAQRPVADLLDAVRHDIHPPGYYLLLKGWIGLVGESEFGLRALSAYQGLLAVAAALALGRALFGRATSLIAGVVIALSPFAVYYSQEARMYAQLALLSTLSLWLLVLWDRRRRAGDPAAVRWALALALVNAAGLYTQYTYPFTLLAQGVMAALWLAIPATRHLKRVPDWRGLRDFVALNTLALLLFLPWLPTAWEQVTMWPSTGVALAPGEQARTIFTWLTYGSTAGAQPWLALLWPLILVLAGVLWRTGWQEEQRAGWPSLLPVTWGGIVVVALAVSGAYREANLKFLLPAQVAVALLIGRGVCHLWMTAIRLPRLTLRELGYIRRMMALVCFFLLIMGQLEALNTLYTDPRYARPDYRAIAAQIMADPRPGDAIILNAPNQAEVFSYYYTGTAPVWGLPRGLGGDDAQTRAATQAIIDAHQRIFVLFWGEDERDPNRIVQAVLDANAYPVSVQWVGDVRFAQYAVLGDAPDAPTTTLEARFGAPPGDVIALLGYALNAEALRPGDVLGVTLFWSADAPLETRYQITVQLLGPDGALVGQHDGEPANHRAPTTTWTPGQTVTDLHGLIVPPDLAPGVYTVIVGVYDPAAPLNRLPVMLAGDPQGDTLTLATLATH